MDELKTLCSSEIIDGQLVVLYDVDRSAQKFGQVQVRMYNVVYFMLGLHKICPASGFEFSIVAPFQVVDGYFLHFVSPPEDIPAGKKSLIFALDISGSMAGSKLNQVKVCFFY